MATVIKQKKGNSPFPGFEQLGFTVHPDAETNLVIPYVAGKYQMGFEENPEKKAYFEKLLGVVFDSPEGEEFIQNFSVNISHDETILSDSPVDQFALYILKLHRGFGVVAFDNNQSGPVDTTTFELFDKQKDLDSRVSKKLLIGQAVSKLTNLYETERARVLLLARYLFEINSGMDSDEAAFDRLSEYIQHAPDASRFLRALEEDSERIDAVVTIKLAISKNIIRMENNKYINFTTKNVIGRNFDEMVLFCLDPQNQDEIGIGASSDAPYSIKSQLKNSLR